jgi:hypothetical protein
MREAFMLQYPCMPRRVLMRGFASSRGLVLLFVLGVILGMPLLWWGDNSMHPLSTSESVRLCDLLPRWTGLPAAAIQAGADSTASEGGGTCAWRMHAAVPVLSVAIQTTRSASRGAPVDLEKFMALWLEEARADGAKELVEEQAGPWRHAASYTERDQRVVLVEDGGILLVLRSTVAGTADLLRYAAECAQTLRSARTDA